MMILAAALLGFAGALPGAAPQEKAAGDPMAEYKALEREFQDAQDAYYEPYAKAKTDEEREKIQLDPKKEPTRVYLQKFKDLAKKAKGTEAGARSLLWILGNARSMKSQNAIAALQELAKDYIDSPLLADAAAHLQYGTMTVGPDHAIEALTRMSKDSPHAEVRAAALFSRGAIMLSEKIGTPEEAKALFQEVQEKYASTPMAERAASFLFEAEHLQIGMTAPDFQTVDENGNAWKLSDYKGKVVVIDFWGFW